MERINSILILYFNVFQQLLIIENSLGQPIRSIVAVLCLISRNILQLPVPRACVDMKSVTDSCKHLRSTKYYWNISVIERKNKNENMNSGFPLLQLLSYKGNVSMQTL